jgi:hypothetical protein
MNIKDLRLLRKSDKTGEVFFEMYDSFISNIDIDEYASNNPQFKDYNGWSNWDTWILALYINNEQGIYNTLIESHIELSDFIIYLLEYAIYLPEEVDEKKINFREIYDSFYDGVDFDEDLD